MTDETLIKFATGQKLRRVSFPDESCYQISFAHCEAITVCMENGEMAPVAWFVVTFDNERQPVKVNSKHVEMVELL